MTSSGHNLQRNQETSQFITCHICEKDIPKGYMQIHMKNEIHKSNAQIMDISMERSRKILTQHNFIDAEKLGTLKYCDVCNTSFHKAKVHLKSAKHKKLTIYKELLPKISFLYKNPENNLHMLDDMLMILKKLHINEEVKENKEETEGDTIYCDVCKVYKSKIGFSDHIKGKKHMQKVKDQANIREVSDEKSVTTKEDFCDVCQLIIAKTTVACHVTSKTHINNCIAKNIAIQEIDNLTFCKICQIYITNRKIAMHILSGNHIANEKVGKKDERTPKAPVENRNENPKVTLEKYIDISTNTCNICNIKIANIKEHINSEEHCSLLYYMFMN